MAVVFLIPGYLRTFTEGQKRVTSESASSTVRDALDSLATKYPGVRDRILTETGEVRPHVNIFVGTESIRYTGGLDTPISAGEEISIVPAVSGGTDSPVADDFGEAPESDRAPEVDQQSEQGRGKDPAVSN
ncbi:MAG TPA: ubiquitin-like small modifier protein 1 [Myxococcaceae bacterium]|nr:ubiquitin-like small modifier protein 1 [Myxococcaceae bacterium]